MYVKLFGTILDSSVWSESHTTVRVWITALVMADAEGYIQASPAGFARRACVTRPEFDEALAILGAPDPDSQSADEDGRRLVADGPGLWRVVNYGKYREIQTKQQQRTAARVRKHRAKSKQTVTHNARNVTGNSMQKQKQKQKQMQRESESESDPSLDRDGEGGPTPEDLRAVYDEARAGSPLPGTVLTDGVRRAARAALRRSPDLDAWHRHFTAAARTPHLRGDTGSWRANFAWLVKKSNVEKCVAGTYRGYDVEYVLGERHSPRAERSSPEPAGHAGMREYIQRKKASHGQTRE